MTTVYIICVSFLIIFFITALLARKKSYPFVAILFVAFIGLTYLSMIEVLGLARPLYSDLPLIGFKDIKGSETWLDTAYIENNKYVYLLLDQNNVKRLYVENYDPNEVDQLKKAYKLNGNRWGFKIGIVKSKHYSLLGYESHAHVDLGQFQHPNIPKGENTNTTNNDGIETDNVTKSDRHFVQ